MNRYDAAAIARAVVAVTIGAMPFAAIGVLVSWWIAGGALAACASVVTWWVLVRMPRWRPW